MGIAYDMTIVFTLLMAGSLTTVLSQGCDSNTQCELDYTRFNTSEITCTNNTYGPTDDPCYGHWSSFSSCSCVDPNGRLSSTGATYWCQGSDPNKGEWDSGLYSLECFAPCTMNAGPNVIAEHSTGALVTIVKDGEYVLYYCPDGYTGIGTSQVTCSDGVWDDPAQFVCLADCNLPEYYVYADGTSGSVSDGTSVSMRCQDGYTPTDLIVRECNNGTYADVPVCQLVTTTVPTTTADI